jgi:hypothetical protein
MKKVFEYMGWDKIEDCDACDLEYCEGSVLDLPECRYRGDGNDMVLAINAMREKGDWDKFFKFFYNKIALIADVVGDPENFFKLMEEWIEEVEKDEKAD